MKIYTYRYMWKLKSSNQVNFRIVTDSDVGLAAFEEALVALEDLEIASKEYLHELDCSKISQIQNIFVGGSQDGNETSRSSD